ncbi:MAG TPA: glutamine amidotransferase, partial [Verrucomicrobiae bacterium]
LRNLAPPPRKRLTVAAVLPLLGFLVLFGAGCWFVSLQRLVQFSNLAPFGLLVLSVWIWWLQLAGYSGLSGGRGTVALLVRLLVLGTLILALTEPRIIWRNHGLALVYALDVSDSMGEKVSDQSLSYILKTAGGKPEKDEAGLVVFGRDAAVELPPRLSFPFEVINARVAKDGTDLAKALSLAAAVVPEDKQGRIVLASDGVETEGNVAGMLDDLKSRHVAVDVLPVQYEYQHEVWLERLDLPRQVKIGETYEASVLLNSLQAGDGKLVLRENGKAIAEQSVHYERGKNRYALPLYFREPGYYEYMASIEPPAGQDGWRENNTAINFLYLKGEGKVLLVTDPQGDARDWETLVKALKEAKRLVDVRSAFEFPRDAMSLMPYDCVVFVNVPADSFDAVQMQALREAVYNQGTGFLMVGGKNSFGPGGYHRTPIEEALPVDMDIQQKKVMPKGALAIVLHTCEFPEGNVWAKRIAKEAIRVLGAQDEAGLLIYGSSGSGTGNWGDQWVFPLTPVSEYDRLVTLINHCEPSDMPSFQSIMTLGLSGLKTSDAATKHMIIISDGDPSPPTPELVQQFVAEKISVSTVVINPHGGMDIPAMQALAAVTGGRHYLVGDPNELPSIFIKEAKTLKRSMIQNTTFVPSVEFSSPVLKGIEGMPPLHAYVLTTPKARSVTILKGPEKEEINPVLSTWRFGLGKTAAFTSDLSPNWGSDWVQWGQYEAFVKQLMIEISRVEQHSDLNLQAFASGDEGVMLVDDYHPQESMLEVQAQISGPHERQTTLSLKQTGPRRYEGRFPLWGKGRYQIALAGVGAGRSDQSLGGFVVAYSPEYLRFRSNPIILREIAARTGGRILTGQETGKDLFTIPREPKESSKSIVDWLLVLLACLIPLDVGVRRVQLDWSVIRGWFGVGRKTESTETLGALLRRKETVRQTTDAERKPLPAMPSRTTAAPGRPSAPVEKTSANQPAPEPEAPASTTERLLAMKRKRQQDEKNDDTKS